MKRICSIFALAVVLTGASVALAAGPKTSLFADLGDAYYTPDGMTVADATSILYLNVPNFGLMDENKKKSDSAQGGYLLKLDANGNATKLLEYPVHEATGQCGPMGLDCGPDGNLYVCDNQFFHTDKYCSRILRVVLDKDGVPTGEVETVVEGAQLANGIVWFGGNMFYTDSVLPFEASDDIIGAGAVFCIPAAEALKAGRNGAPAVKVKAAADDPHCLAYEKVVKLGRGDNTGCDGITVDKNGVVWFGNFGNGYLYGAYPDENGEYKRENVCNVFNASTQKGFDFGEWKGVKFECCDGIFYDAGSNRVLIDDSVNNAIWAFEPCAKGETVKPYIVLKNDVATGADGQLDQPCEAVIYGGKVLFVNFDWPFPGMVNTKTDKPGTIVGVPYAELKPVLLDGGNK